MNIFTPESSRSSHFFCWDRVEKEARAEMQRERAYRKMCRIMNEANLTGSDNVGDSGAASEVGACCDGSGVVAAQGDAADDGGGDGDSDPEPEPEPHRQPFSAASRPQRPRAKTRPRSAVSTRAPRNADNRNKIPDALANFDWLPDSAYVRLPVVCGLYACSPATVWRHVKAGTIPACVKLSERVTAWLVGDLRAALANLRSHSAGDETLSRCRANTSVQKGGDDTRRTRSTNAVVSGVAQ